MKSFRDFINDKRGNVSVGLLCIILIPTTFAAWLIVTLPTLMLIDTLTPMVNDPHGLAIFSMARVVLAAVLIGEIVVLIVWWIASSFRQEDQTYQVGYSPQ